MLVVQNADRPCVGLPGVSVDMSLTGGYCDQPHRRRASPCSGARHAGPPVDPSQGYPH